jgi:SAM-dependent methyltransferase
MLKWTGERFLPWLREPILAHEHLHRYAYAAEFVKGKRVLDLASGEGYGSKILGANATYVVGVDIDGNAVQHARTKYTSGNLQFACGSITDLPFSKHCFDVVVCFEAIEHIEQQEKLLAEVKRLLCPEGLFISSTPNKSAYRENEDHNRFHVRELSLEEFAEIVGRQFRNVYYLGQRVHLHSNIWPLMEHKTKNAVHEFAVERGEREYEFVSNKKRVPLYIIAIASDFPGSVSACGSILVDHSDSLLRDKDTLIRELSTGKALAEEALQWRFEQLAERERAIHMLEEQLQAKQLELTRVFQSRSWRVTRPLRWVGRHLHIK